MKTLLFVVLPVSLWASSAVAQEAVTQPAANSGVTVIITGDRTEMDAYLDGKRVGLTPARVTGVQPGEHTARVEGGEVFGERRFSVGTADRTIAVPFEGLARPLSLGIEGALGFRGGSALVDAGAGFTYHLINHEIGIAADWFNLRGSSRFDMQGVVARIQYAFVPWWTAGGNGVLIRPLKLLARINVAQTTELVEDVAGNGTRRDDVAGLGAGAGIATEVQFRSLGIEPSLYYDYFGFRSIAESGSDIRPKLDNGGLNLKIKYYFP